MKKILNILFALLILLAVLTPVSAAGNKEVDAKAGDEMTPVQKVIADAQTMTYEELIVKAKEEVGDNKMVVYGNSSSLSV